MQVDLLSYDELADRIVHEFVDRFTENKELHKLIHYIDKGRPTFGDLCDLEENGLEFSSLKGIKEQEIEVFKEVSLALYDCVMRLRDDARFGFSLSHHCWRASGYNFERFLASDDDNTSVHEITTWYGAIRLIAEDELMRRISQYMSVMKSF